MALAKLFASQQVAASTAVPTLADASPEYGELLGLQSELQLRLNNINEEKARLDDFLATSARSGVSAYTRESDIRIAALIGDVVEDESILGKRTRCSELVEEERDVRRAMEIVTDRLRAARRDASQIICGQIADHHGQLVAEIGAKMIELGHAVANYYRLVDDLNQKEVAWTSLKPSQPPFIGDPNDPYGSVRLYLNSIAASGFIVPASIPERF